jgi:hypothetical protein
MVDNGIQFLADRLVVLHRELMEATVEHGAIFHPVGLVFSWGFNHR